MLRTIGTPMSGRPCLLASLLLMSVFGLLVWGSFGSASQVSVPQMAPPQLTIFTLPFLSPVNHVPIGSAANACVIDMSPSATADAATSALARRFFMKRPPDTLLASQGKRIAYEDAIASSFAATNFR